MAIEIREQQSQGETFLRLDATTLLVKSESGDREWHTIALYQGRPASCDARLKNVTNSNAYRGPF
jgi:hypothetical protein